MKNLLLSWLLSAISLLIVSYLVPGFEIAGFTSALIAAVVIGLVNGTLGLLLKIITFPLSFVTLGLGFLIINALMILLAARLVGGFHVSGFWPAFFGSIVLSLVNSFLGSLAGKKDSKSD